MCKNIGCIKLQLIHDTLTFAAVPFILVFEFLYSLKTPYICSSVQENKRILKKTSAPGTPSKTSRSQSLELIHD